MLKKMLLLVKKTWEKVLFSFRIRVALGVDKLVIIQKHQIQPHKLLIVRTDAIGDYLLFRNFLEVLKHSQRFRNYEITLCGNAVWQDLTRNYDQKFLADFIPIYRKKFFENPIYRYRTQKKIHKKGFEIAINPTFSDELLYGHSIIRASNARSRIGSVGDSYNLIEKDKKIADSFYTEQLFASSEMLFAFYRNQEFFEKLLQQKIELKKPQLPKNKNFVFDLEPQKYIILFSGASTPERCWSAHNFRKIAQKIHEHWKLKIVLAGSPQDAIYAQKIMMNNTTPFINLVGKTTLTQFVALIQNARFLLTNETSAVHVGACTQTPSLCISINAWHYGRFTPYPKEMRLPIYSIFPSELQNLTAQQIRKQYPEQGMLNVNSITWEEVWESMETICDKLAKS